MWNKRFNFGDLNPNISPRNGLTIDPLRFNTVHLQQRAYEELTTPAGFKNIPGPLKGIVLRVEGITSENDLIEGFSGLPGLPQEGRVKIKVRIPEIHPFPDPDTYGPEGQDGIISLYPTFIGIETDLPIPAVGDIVYVDYADRDNLEFPRYYGKVSNIS